MTTPQRWQEIDRIFAAALEREPGARSTFLAEACGDDEQLRAEVESLIAHDTPESFVTGPAVEEATRLLANENMRGPNVTNIGPYQVVKLLGAGGMGKVYLAHDPRLNRQVAVKLLSHYGEGEEEPSLRFRQEALAASALNHPNILTIHEIGEFEGQNYIATEFIDGVTLRARLSGGELPPPLALDIAIQLASALSAAHEAGIVHRDIKPDNVMIRGDGLVKALDFGIAKHTAQNGRQTQDQLETTPGSVVGTAPYMSPEQASGLPVDARSDIWSLGVVLYEMVTGRLPFSGKTATETISLILQQEPAPLAHHAPEEPAELERIVTKALKKNREDRYQTTKDILIDLRNLKSKREVDAAIERTVSPEFRHQESAGNEERTRAPASVAVAATNSDDERGELSSTVSVAGARPRLQRMAVAALVIVAAATAVGIYWLITHRREEVLAAVPFRNINLSRLTTSGTVTHAAISSDGRYLAHVVKDADGNSVWVKHVGAPSNVRIAGPAAAEYLSVTFAPNSNNVYYIALDHDKGESTLYRVSALGGQPEIVAKDIYPVGFSPDGRKIAFIRFRSTESHLVVAAADGSNQRDIATRQKPDAFELEWNAPAWSPDGKTIAVPARLNDQRGHYGAIVGVNIADGTQRPLTSMRWNYIGQPLWLTNGGGLVLAASDRPDSPTAVWYVSLPDGKATQITHDLNNYVDLSITSDASRLAVVQVQSVSNIWAALEANGRGARQVKSEIGSLEVLAWTRDERLVYRSSAGGSGPDIWIMEADGTNARQLTVGAGVSRGLAVTPDIRHIVFSSDTAGQFNLWRVDIDGGNLRQLTAGNGEFYPQCTPDGRWVVYQSNEVIDPKLWKVPIEGGEPVQLTQTRATRPSVSPDGQMIAYSYLDIHLSPSRWGIGIVSSEGGERLRRFDFPSTVAYRQVRWSPDGKSIGFVNSPAGLSDIWLQPLDGSPPKPMTNFKAEEILAFDWSRDGRSLAFVRGVKTSDVVLIEEGQK